MRKRILRCRIVDKKGDFIGAHVSISVPRNTFISDVVRDSKLKPIWKFYSVAGSRLHVFAPPRDMTEEEKNSCSNNDALELFVKNLTINAPNKELRHVVKVKELKSFVGKEDYPLFIQLPITVITNEPSIVEIDATKISRIQRGKVSQFYSSSFKMGDNDRVQAYNHWNKNQPLRRFVRRLREYSVIDLHSLNQCQSCYTFPLDAFSLHCVWQNEPSLNFALLSTVVPSTPLEVVSSCIESSQFLPLMADKYAMLRELQSIRPLIVTANPVQPNEELMNYLNNSCFLAADFEFQSRRSCNGKLRMEMMASGPIYTPMLSLALRRIGPHLENMFKYSGLNLTCMNAYVSEHYADMSVAIKGNHDRLYPTFIAEYATNDDQDVTAALAQLNIGNRDDTITKFYERLLSHKDREKLVGAMAAALMQIVSSLLKFDDYYSKDDFEKIRIWGALVENWSVLFLQLRLHIPSDEMYREMKSGQFDMLLVTQKEWLIMLQSADAVKIVNAREFIDGSVKVWDICLEINRDSAFIAELLGRTKDLDDSQATGSLGDICFGADVTTMSKSITTTANLQTPNAKSGFPALEQSSSRTGSSGSKNEIDDNDGEDNISMTFDEFIAGGQSIVTKALESALETLQEQDFKIEHVGPVRRNDIPVLVQVSRNQAQFMALIKPTVRCGLECELLKSIHSKHIVSLLHCEPIPMTDPWMLMIEPILYQDQSQLLHPKYCPDQVKRYRNVLELCSDALEALKALQDSLIIHRDIKPQHLMRNRVDKCWVLIDLDCSLLLTHLQDTVYDDPKVWRRGPPGSQGFRAPEVEQSQNYGLAADVFSMGQTLISIISSQESFSVTDKKLNPWCEKVQKDLTNLLYQMTAEDPSDRPFVPTALLICNVLQSSFTESKDTFHVYGSIEHRMRTAFLATI